MSSFLYESIYDWQRMPSYVGLLIGATPVIIEIIIFTNGDSVWN